MRESITRRSLIRGVGAALAGTGVASAAGSASAYEYTRSLPISGSGAGINASATKYVERDPAGALWADIYLDSRRKMVFKDIHTMVHDGYDVYNTRDDVATAEINVTTPQVPEAYIDVTIPVAGGTVSLTQTGLVCKRGTLLLQNEASLPSGAHSFYTLANPTLGDVYSDPDAGDTVWTTSRGYYDVIVASNGSYAVAFAQREGWRKQFDDHYVGTIRGQSAWEDLYVEGDGDLDDSASADGRVDYAAELSAGTRDSMQWLSAFGFASESGTAIDRAIASLEEGYESERQRHISF